MTEVIIEVTKAGYINAYSYSDNGERLAKEKILRDVEDVLGKNWSIHTVDNFGDNMVINQDYIMFTELGDLLDTDIHCLPVSSTWVITSVISY